LLAMLCRFSMQLLWWYLAHNQGCEQCVY
jgi:hypothetical protein